MCVQHYLKVETNVSTFDSVGHIWLLFYLLKKKANCPSSKFWDDLYYLHIKKAGGGGKEGHIIFQFGFVLLISEWNYVFDSFSFLKNCSSISLMFLFSNKGFNLPDIWPPRKFSIFLFLQNKWREKWTISFNNMSHFAWYSTKSLNSVKF